VEALRQQSALHEIDPLVQEVEAASPPSETATVKASNVFALTEVLWERRRLFLRVTVSALLASTILVFLIPRKYDATTSIMPPDSMSDSGMMFAALAGSKASPELASLASTLIGAKTTGATFVALLSSRSVQEGIVNRFHLQTVYWVRHKEDARRVLKERTNIDEDRKSGVIAITVRDRSPERARDMAQAYVEELNRLVAQVATSSARRKRIFIEQRLASVKTDLEDAEKQFSEFASKNTVLDVKEQAKAMVESAAVLQGQFIAAQSELQGLEQVYSQNNVRVRAAHARVEELKSQLQKIDGNNSSLLSDGTQTDQPYPSIRQLPLLGVTWADLYRRVKTQETVFELLTQQYEMARIEEAKEIPSVNVIDPAELPESKAFPPRILLVTAMIAASLTIAAAWVFGLWQLNQLQPEDPRKILVMRVVEAGSRVVNIRRMGRQSWSSEQGLE
jgi:capsule polysaccharide export protein KpsE/RkpR